MRGPSDEAIETLQGTTTAEAPAERPRLSRTIPGGKALIRLLQTLESAGYTEAAEAAVELAVRGEARAELRSRTERFSAAPTPEMAVPAIPARRTRRTRRERTETAAEGEGRSAENPQLARAYSEQATRLAVARPGEPQWRNLGPWTIPNGQTYGNGRVNVSGRLSAIAIDPTDSSHVLVGAANGGVWESRDRGNSWSPRTDFAATLTVGALAFDPGNPRIVYCGTGEGNWWSWLGDGILRSVDGGTNWAPLAVAPFEGQGFYDLLVDPDDGQHLLAATTGGLYISTDAGQNWTQSRGAATWSLARGRVRSTTEYLAACSDGVWSSADGGATWSTVALPNPPAFYDRLAVAIAPSNNATAYVWASGDGSAHLWRRSQSSWTTQAVPPDAAIGQAWYDWFLAVAPDRDGQVYCGAIDVHRGDLTGTTWTWTNISSKTTPNGSIHPDQHAIAFDPRAIDTVYVGNDGGLYRSADRGATWQQLNNGLVISEMEYLAQNFGTSRWLMGGTQDNGTDRWAGSSVWDHIADGDGGDCGVNRIAPTTVFHTYYGMSLERSTSSGDFETWTWIAPPVPADEGSLFYPPFECSMSSGDTIGMGGDALYVSRNSGTDWTRLAFPGVSRSSAIYIPNADTVYVGVTDGGVFRARWNGTSWQGPTALTTPRTNAYVSDVLVDPGNSQNLWVTYRNPGGGRVFRSTDGGNAWNDRTANLPDLPINAIEIDPRNANRLWVAADLGVYQSQNGGTNWSDFGNGLPNAFVGELVFHPHARVLRAGMRNRGVWEIPVDGWITQPLCGVQWTGSLAANTTRRWFTFNWPATWHIVWTVMPTSAQSGAPQVSWTVQVERANAEYVTYWISVRNLTAKPVTFEGRYCILSRY
jgi:photosystem II stability/assembly factor-like uncharacterized protein